MGFYSRPVCSCPTFQHPFRLSLLAVKNDMGPFFHRPHWRYQTAELLLMETVWLGLHPSILFGFVKSNSLLLCKNPKRHSSIFCFPWIWVDWSGAESPLLSLQPNFFCTLFSLFKRAGCWHVTHKGLADTMLKPNNIIVPRREWGSTFCHQQLL